MITGIGTDIIDIRRIEKLLNCFPKRFTEKVFTSNERAYCQSKHNPSAAYAKRYAAKEAFLKALGTGMRNGANWQAIEILNAVSGKPELHAPTLLKAGQDCHLSLSDDYPYAIAYVVIAGRPGTQTCCKTSSSQAN